MASSSRKHGRRSFLAGAAALGGAGLVPRPAAGFVPAHNWDGYDWGTAPPVRDRLNQGPFPQYPPEEVLPGSEVVMATTPSDDVVPGYGKGLVTYLTGDFAAATFEGQDAEATIEAFAQIPLGQKLYLRPTWRDLQKRPGRLDPEEYWSLWNWHRERPENVLAYYRQYPGMIDTIARRIGYRVRPSFVWQYSE